MRRSAILLLALAAACDASPTAIENLDRSRVEWLVTRGAPAGTSQRVLLDLFDRLAAPDPAPGRLPGLDSLFALAVSDELRFSPAAGAATYDEHRARLESAWSAIGRGDRSEGETGLERARAFQTETIVRVLGPGAAVAWLALVSRTLDHARQAIAEVDDGNGEDASRGAIALTARDLLADAGHALARGNGAAALDLTAHAAGLVNLLLERLPQF